MAQYDEPEFDTDVPTLSEQNRELLERYLEALPADARALVTDSVQTAAEATGALRPLAVGDRAPDFTLRTPDGEAVQLGEHLDRGPVVLSFHRGGWCRFCSLELRALQRRQPAIEALGGRIIAVSPEGPDEARRTRQRNRVSFDVVSDPRNTVAATYGLVFPFYEHVEPVYREWGIDLPDWALGRLELPIPATYVIDTDGRIATAFADPDYTRRLEPSDAINALRALQ